MITRKINGLYQFYPCIVTLVGAQRGNQVNYMAAAWNTGISHTPPLFGVSIAPKRFTHDMIVESGEFTCNFLGMEQVNKIHGSGKLSGSTGDKVKALDIELEDSIEVACPTIKTAYAAYECRVVDQVTVGDHTLFVGRVVALHQDEQTIDARGLLDPNKLKFAMYLGSNTYISADPQSVQIMPTEFQVV